MQAHGEMTGTYQAWTARELVAETAMRKSRTNFDHLPARVARYRRKSLCAADPQRAPAHTTQVSTQN